MRASMSRPVWCSVQMLCSLWLILISCSVTTEPAESELGLDDVFFHPQSLKCEEGHDAFLQCVSGDSFPPAQIVWWKNGKVFTKGNQIQGQYGGGNEKKTSGTLHISNVTKSDQGIYVCVAHNLLLNVSKESQPAVLTVIGSSVNIKITKGPYNLTVPVEKEAVLNCIAEGFPVPTIRWFKDGQPLAITSRVNLQKDGQLLSLQRVLPEDEGLYFCEASNEREKVISQPAYILPEDWTFFHEPVNLTVKKGDPATLPCELPPYQTQASVLWFKNNQRLLSGSQYSTDTNGDLLLHSAQETDSGIFFCKTFTLKKTLTSKKIFLEILGPPTVTIWPLTLRAPVGSEAEIHCHVMGHPAPLTKWSKQGQSVKTGGKLITGLKNITLHFSSVRVYDEGRYTCTAYNAVGRDERTMTLQVAADPDKEDLQGKKLPTIETSSKQEASTSFSLDGTGVWNETETTQSVPFNTKDYTENLYLETFVDDLPTYSESTQDNTKLSFINPTKMNIGEEEFVKSTPTRKPIVSIDSTHTSVLEETFEQQTHVQSTDQISRSLGIHSTSRPSPSHESGQASVMNIKNFTDLNLVEKYPNQTETIKQSQGTNETDAIDRPKKNTSQAPMRTTDNNARQREKAQSWLPVIEKHDIPIVIGVGVSLAFIFISMAFYSLVQKNDSVAVPTGRAALRVIGGPCRQEDSLTMENTYDNKAFEDDNLVAVIEHSPNISSTRVLQGEESPSSGSDDGFQLTQDLPVIVESQPKPGEEDEMEILFEEGKVSPQLSDIQLQCLEDWKCPDFQSSREALSSPSANPPEQEDSLRSSLTLQTSETGSTPVRHSINISHGFTPLLLSHCVSVGTTSVAVDVHFYPSAPPATSRDQQVNSRLENVLMTPTPTHSK